MKKIRFILFLFLFAGFPIFAQEEAFNVDGETTVLTQALDMSQAYNNKINDVVMRFCNDTDDLSTKIHLDFRPKQKKEICVVLENKSTENLDIIASLVSASLNENWNIICANDGELQDWFSLISDSWLEEWFELQATEQQMKYFKLQAHEFASGDYYACFVINLSESTSMWDGSPFNLVIRKALNISTTVSGKVSSFGFLSDFVDYINQNIKIIAIIWFSICAIGFVIVVIPSKKK